MELMVTIAIIALLSGIVMANLSSSKGRSRDSKRVSDMNTLQLSLSLYFDRCKQYPDSLVTTANNGCPSGISLASYISTIPTAPSSGSYSYDVSATRNDYVLKTTLESYNEIIKDGLQGTVSITTDFGTHMIRCAGNDPSGTPYNIYCLGPK